MRPPRWRWRARAVAAGARLLLLPEYANALHSSGRVMREAAREERRIRWCSSCAAFARESGAWILLGSVTVPVEERRIATARCCSRMRAEICRALRQAAHVRTRRCRTGARSAILAVTARATRRCWLPLPWGPLGLERLLRRALPLSLSRAGGPAAARLPGRAPRRSPRPTGPLHWHRCCVARAIENRLLRLRAGHLRA